jgi:hypothetical protein
VLRIANIGLPGAQLVLLFDPYPPPPAKLDQPSLGAADWLGLTQLTTIQSPAYAGAAPIIITAAAALGTSSAHARTHVPHRAPPARTPFVLLSLSSQARPERIGSEGSKVCSSSLLARPEPEPARFRWA